MGFKVDYPGGLQRRVIAMFDPLAMEIEELWKKHKQRFDQVPSLDWAPPEIMVKALRAALERGDPVTKDELTGGNVIRLSKYRYINCRVFL